MLTQYIAGFPETSPRLRALETRIGIGTGFHNKWYRSQKEHMLGWMRFQAYQISFKGGDHKTASAEPVWNRLKCMPAMFWLAEAAGLSEDALIRAEALAGPAALERPTDGGSHGKIIRKALPWTTLEKALLNEPPDVNQEQAIELSKAAYARLAAKVSKYRRIEEQCEGKLLE